MPLAPKTHRAHPKPPRVYDDRRRGTANDRGYGTKENKSWAKAVKERDCYLCQRCKKQGKIVPGNIADHIEPKDVSPGLALDVANGMTLCRSCHAIKTHEDIRRYGPVGQRVRGGRFLLFR